MSGGRAPPAAAGALGAVHHGEREREQRNGAAVRLTVVRGGGLTVVRGGGHTGAGIGSLARQHERAGAMNYTQSSRRAFGPAT